MPTSSLSSSPLIPPFHYHFTEFTMYYPILTISRYHVNSFARRVLRNHYSGNQTFHRQVRLIIGNCGGCTCLNDHLSSPSRDRVNQRVCKKRTKEPPKWKINPPPPTTHQRSACLIRGDYEGSAYLNDH